jgi:hypothetical protein
MRTALKNIWCVRRRTKIVLLLLVLAGVAYLVHWEFSRGPIYEGRHVAEWVADALSQDSGMTARDMVVKIGKPAVPFVARAMHDRCHRLGFLSSGRVGLFSANHPHLLAVC